MENINMYWHEELQKEKISEIKRGSKWANIILYRNRSATLES
jgi:hypothetical protein